MTEVSTPSTFPFSRISHEFTTRVFIIKLIINHAYKLPISVKRKCHKWRGTATGDHYVSETPRSPPAHRHTLWGGDLPKPPMGDEQRQAVYAGWASRRLAA